jgi:polyhydroxyalkanoate synthesis regulator phasin
MTENWTETPNRVLDLVSDSYNSLLNTWLWSTQRVLEFNKVLVSQFETNQVDSRKYVEDLSGKARQAIQILQEVYQEGLKTYSGNLSALRSASESSVAELNRKLEEIQQRFEASAH